MSAAKLKRASGFRFKNSASIMRQQEGLALSLQAVGVHGYSTYAFVGTFLFVVEKKMAKEDMTFGRTSRGPPRSDDIKTITNKSHVF